MKNLHRGLAIVTALLLLIIIISAESTLTASAFQGTFQQLNKPTSKTVTVNSNEGEQDPVVVKGTFYAIYTVARSVILAWSNNGGATFSYKRVDNGSGATTGANLATSDGNLYMIWLKGSSIQSRTLFANKTDSKIVNLGVGIAPEMAASGNDVYVAFNNGSGIITVAYSHNYGLNYSRINVSSLGSSGEATIAAHGSNVYAAWEDAINNNRTIYEAASHDNGTTFVSHSLTPNSNDSREPRIAISTQTGYVYMTWREDPTRTLAVVYVASSYDKGATFNIQAVTPADTVSRESIILAVGPNVYDVFRERNISGSYDVDFVVSNNSGATFSTPFDLSGSTGITKISSEDNTPALSVQGSTIYFAWNNDTSVLDRTSTNGGLSFSPVITLGLGNNSLISQQYVIWQHNSTAIDFAIV